MKFLHTMLRVGDLDRSINFYTENFAMKLIRKHDNKEYKYTLAFVGYGDEKNHTVLEFTYNWGTENYDIGNAFGHLALGVDDIYKTCDKLKANGIEITREPGPVKGGKTVIAFLKDPDGYPIELIQQDEKFLKEMEIAQRVMQEDHNVLKSLAKDKKSKPGRSE